MTSSNMEDLVDLLNKQSTAYFGEPVSVLEHSLQSAHSAELARARAASIAAALLHIRHMIGSTQAS